MALRICLQSPCLAHKALAQLVAALPRYSTFFSPGPQVVLFLLSTKDITESYTASRGPSIYSMESDPVANDENKVD